MKHFNAQFKLPASLVFAWDNFIYARGVQILGRTSGMWSSKKWGDVWSLLLGDGDVPVGPDGKVRVENPLAGGSYLLTPEHASLAFSLLVVNWFWNMHAEKMPEETFRAFETAYYGLLDACRDTGDRDLLRFID